MIGLIFTEEGPVLIKVTGRHKYPDHRCTIWLFLSLQRTGTGALLEIKLGKQFGRGASEQMQCVT